MNLPSPQPLWSIADVERDTGLAKDTLRVWEKRYGFPTPGRDAGGERQYDLTQLQKLRWIKRLIDAGHRPHQIVSRPDTELELMVRALESANQACIDPETRFDVSQWLQWLRDNQTDALRRALQDHLLRHGLASTIEDLVAPLSVQVGLAWFRGELSIFQEHLFTETVQVMLRESISVLDKQAANRGVPPRVLLTTLPNEHHAMGLLMAECFLALERCIRFPLGPSTPLVDIVGAVQELSIDVVAMSFSAHMPANETVQQLRQLRSLLPDRVQLWAGGSAAVLHTRRIPKGVQVLRKASALPALVAAWREQPPEAASA